METTLTEAQAREILAAHGGYGSVRVYGIIAEGEEGAGQILPIKSDYHLKRYTFARIYSTSTTIADLIRKA